MQLTTEMGVILIPSFQTPNAQLANFLICEVLLEQSWRVLKDYRTLDEITTCCLGVLPKCGDLLHLKRANNAPLKTEPVTQ